MRGGADRPRMGRTKAALLRKRRDETRSLREEAPQMTIKALALAALVAAAVPAMAETPWDVTLPRGEVREIDARGPGCLSTSRPTGSGSSSTSWAISTGCPFKGARE